MANVKSLVLDMGYTNKREVFKALKEYLILQENSPEGMVDFISYLEQQEKEKANKPKTLTKSQKENLIIKENILELLRESDENLTATEITAQYNTKYGTQFSKNKIISLLTQLRQADAIQRDYEKKNRFLFYKIGG